MFWSPQSDLNRRPFLYEGNALPLSYGGLLVLNISANEKNFTRGHAGSPPADPALVTKLTASTTQQRK